MFLSGTRSTMEKLYRAAKEHKAINEIIARMKEEKFPRTILNTRRPLKSVTG